MMMKFHVMIALLYGLIALVSGSAGLITTKTRIFSKFLGGDDLTLVAIVTASEATLSVTTASASIGTEVLVTPGVFLSTVQPNHALPYIVTLTSTTTPTSTSSAAVGGLMSSFSPNDVPPYTLTTTSTTSIVTTVTKPIQTVTLTVSEASQKSATTGFCYWGAEAVIIPCTYTAGANDLPTGMHPALTSASNGTATHTPTVSATLSTSLAIPAHFNLIKYAKDQAKRAKKNAYRLKINDVGRFMARVGKNILDVVSTLQVLATLPPPLGHALRVLRHS
ncbi:hypothetical protein B2J93_2007 [Marssonina coronariae]|uniref:Uncharacterized protein n=1 Tax=Diplocarpon coronariae TaxID=2795749 RepID=A0A218ZHJ4_9HELO|nr:hypothetical protein B2J93_2007 [Marssonina coronariae]